MIERVKHAVNSINVHTRDVQSHYIVISAISQFFRRSGLACETNFLDSLNFSIHYIK